MINTRSFEPVGDEPYVLPSQCEQVFYSEVPHKQGWSFVVRHDPRGRPIKYNVMEEEDIEDDEEADDEDQDDGDDDDSDDDDDGDDDDGDGDGDDGDDDGDDGDDDEEEKEEEDNQCL